MKEMTKIKTTATMKATTKKIKKKMTKKMKKKKKQNDKEKEKHYGVDVDGEAIVVMLLKTQLRHDHNQIIINM